MGVWVAQKKSLYSLVATEHCTAQLLQEDVTVVVTEAIWQDVERDLPHLAPAVADELLSLRERGRVSVRHPPKDRVRAAVERTHGELSIRLSSLCALVEVAEGTLLTESVPLIRTLTCAPVYPFSTGVTVARRWLDSISGAPSATTYVERAGHLLMLTPGHPESDWWFAHLLKRYPQ